VANLKSKPTKDRSTFHGRRTFLKATAASVVLPYLIPASAMGNAGNTAPSNRIVMAGIGIGNMGRGDLGSFLGRDDVQYVAVSDVKKDARDGAMKRVNEKYGNKDCRTYNDFRPAAVSECSETTERRSIPAGTETKVSSSRLTLTSGRYRRNATRKGSRSPTVSTGIDGLVPPPGRPTIPTDAAVVTVSTEQAGGRSRITPAAA